MTQLHAQSHTMKHTHTQCTHTMTRTINTHIQSYTHNDTLCQTNTHTQRHIHNDTHTRHTQWQTGSYTKTVRQKHTNTITYIKNKK